MEYAEEKLAEAEAAANENKPEAVATAMANYQNDVSFATNESKTIEDKIKAENLLSIIADNTSKHQEVLAEVLNKVPDEAKEAIIKAIEVSKKGQEEAMKQIAELKGEVEQLKQAVAELKAKDENQTKTIEELGKQKSENVSVPVKSSTSQSPTKAVETKSANITTLPNGTVVEMDINGNVIRTIKEAQQQTYTPPTNIAPPNTISCNGKYWTPCPAGQRFYCPLNEDAQCLIDNVSNQNNQNNSTQNQQQEAARQAEQDKTNQINSLLAEYQQQINEIDAEILAIKEQYYKDVKLIKQKPISMGSIDGQINKLTNDINFKIQKLQLEQESLRIQYLNKINSIQ